MANILANANGDWNVGATWIGGVVPGPGDNAYLNTRTIAIDGDIDCDLISNRAENGASAGGSLTLAITGVTITADMEPGATILLTVTASVDLDVVGVLNGGSTNNIRAINWNCPGTLTVVGNPVTGTGGTGSHSLVISHAGAIVNIIGDVAGGNTVAAPTILISSAGALTITGNLSGGSVAASAAVTSSSTGVVTITGNVAGGSSTTAYGLNLSGASTAVINGDVAGGSGGTAYGVHNNAAGDVTINGDSTGGATATTYGTHNANVGNVTINGASIGSESGGDGTRNASTGTINVVRAVGNSWGPGGTATAAGYGVSNNNVAGVVIVEEVEYGANGMIPTLGTTFFKNVVTNKCITQTAGGTKTLSDPNDTAGLVPDEADVRYLVVYAGGVNTGSLRVADPAAVAAGVLTDDTVGTAVLTVPALTSVFGQVLSDSLSGHLFSGDLDGGEIP